MRFSNPLFDPSSADAQALVDPAPPLQDPPAAAKPTQTPGAGLDLSTQVTLKDGTKVSVGELVQSREGAAQTQQQLEGIKGNIQTLLKEETDEQSRTEAYRKLLIATGFSPDHADAVIASQNQEANKVDNTNTPAPQIPENLPKPGTDEFDRLSKEVAQVRARQASRTLEETLNEAMNGQEIGSYYEKLASLHAEGKDFTESKSLLRMDIKNRLLQRLKSRANAANMFDDDWIKEEAPAIVSEVVKNYGSAIGDLDAIQRSPETGTSEFGGLLATEPVKAPQYQEGTSRSVLETQAKNYTLDALSRAAAELGAGTNRV